MQTDVMRQKLERQMFKLLFHEPLALSAFANPAPLRVVAAQGQEEERDPAKRNNG